MNPNETDLYLTRPGLRGCASVTSIITVLKHQLLAPMVRMKHLSISACLQQLLPSGHMTVAPPLAQNSDSRE